jgi:hypothetical protein
LSIKPLTHSNSNDLLDRFDALASLHIKRINMLSPLHVEIYVNVQDKARGYDWIGLKFEFIDVCDAKLVADSTFDLLDTNDGISILHEDDNVILSLGKYKSFSNAKNSELYICSKVLKYEEIGFIE